MNFKKLAAFCCAALMLSAALGGCAGAPAASSAPSAPASSEGPATAPQLHPVGEVKPDDGKPAGYQLEKPAAGEEIVVFTTSEGVIKLRLFPEAAPLAVANFTGLVGKGYYNGVTFHRIVNDFMIQGGDPTATGSGGESFSGQPFADEFSANLLNLRGAVSMANAGYNTSSSQFFIVQKPTKLTDAEVENTMLGMFANREAYKGYMKLFKMANEGASQAELDATVDTMNKELQATVEAGVPDADKAALQKAVDAYKQNGGTPQLDYKHTVFAQVFEGMDVVDKIAAAEAADNGNGEKSKPVTPVTITKAELQKYA